MKNDYMLYYFPSPLKHKNCYKLKHTLVTACKHIKYICLINSVKIHTHVCCKELYQNN